MLTDKDCVKKLNMFLAPFRMIVLSRAEYAEFECVDLVIKWNDTNFEIHFSKRSMTDTLESISIEILDRIIGRPHNLQ